jgi:hypothetical protein
MALCEWHCDNLVSALRANFEHQIYFCSRHHGEWHCVNGTLIIWCLHWEQSFNTKCICSKCFIWATVHATADALTKHTTFYWSEYFVWTNWQSCWTVLVTWQKHEASWVQCPYVIPGCSVVNMLAHACCLVELITGKDAIVILLDKQWNAHTCIYNHRHAHF